MHRSIALLSSSSLLLALAACGDIADKDYPGEPLVTLHGTVTNPQALAAEDAELKAFLIWLPDSEDAVIADEVVVDANLPAGFTFQVLSPPPAAAIGEQGALAVVLMMTDAQKDDALAQINADGFDGDIDVGVVGLAQGLLFYLETAEQAAAFPRDIDGNPGVVGFNMTGVVTTCDADDVCVEGTAQVPLSSAIPVELVDTDTMTGLIIGG